MKKDFPSKLNAAESFLTLLGKTLCDNDFSVYTGFGAGVGNYILSGILSSDKYNCVDVINDKIHISSLVEVEDPDIKTQIRRKMIKQCSSSIIVFGYGKKDSGTYQEYDIAMKEGKYIIPVMKTGLAAEKIYAKLKKRAAISEMQFLENESKISLMIQEIVQLLIEHKEKKEQELKEKIYSEIALSGIGVFLSYHYKNDHKIAKQITDLVNKDRTNMFTVVQEKTKRKKPESIKNWVDETIKKTKFTILLISQETLNREYVSYEIEKSVENGNTIIPIFIDNGDWTLDDDKLPKGLPQKVRLWYKECGKVNIINWLNEELGI